MEQFVVFKSTRVYPGGNGYQDYRPTTREQAARDAAALSADNPVGFDVLPYLTPEAGQAVATAAVAAFQELLETVAADQAAEPAWFAQLRAQGVAAAFPDDAWANQPE